MKEFNVTGICIPEKHYMADTSKKLEQIIHMIEKEQYFTINRARQYGKTTTFALLERKLSCQYHVIWISFEGVGNAAFQNDSAFVRFFLKRTAEALEYAGMPSVLINDWKCLDAFSSGDDAFDILSTKITELCKSSKKECILMIDEVDKSSDNQIFLNFLGMLRNKYLFRSVGRDITFKSVILAGVYDIKNLKLKLRPDEETKYNSPWNIAADFHVDMSFSPEEIAAMLADYESDHQTGMDISLISQELYFYTSGYPFLVSLVCKWMDENAEKSWTIENIRKAEQELLNIPCTLFDDLIKNYENNPDLQHMIDELLFGSTEYAFTMSDSVIQLGILLGFFKQKQNNVVISNVMFNTLLYNHVLSKKIRTNKETGPVSDQFVQNGRLNMPQVLKKFQELMRAEYRREDENFMEKQGRLLFLCFLKPIINGTGFYYVEPETRNRTRMDIVVAYGGEEHIIELKIWHGPQYRKEGIAQLEAYMDSRNAHKGYLVSFSFLYNKGNTNTCGWISGDDAGKQIFEVVI